MQATGSIQPSSLKSTPRIAKCKEKKVQQMVLTDWLKKVKSAMALERNGIEEGLDPGRS